MQQAIRVVVESDIARFASVWPRTTTPTSSRRYVFQCADLVEVWCDTLGKAQKIEPCFVAVLDARDDPLLLLPLGIRRRKGVRELVFLDADVSDYNAPVLFAGARAWDQSTMRAAWREIEDKLPDFDIAVLKKMPECVGDWPNPLRFLGTGRSVAQGHGMTLPARWNDRGERILPDSAGARRRERQMSKLGTVSIEIAGAARDASHFLDAMIEMKRRHYIEVRGVDLFESEPGYLEFYIEGTRRLLPGCVHLSALKLDGDILAAHWGHVLGERFYMLMPAFRRDGEWPRYSPGRVLNDFLIRWSVSQGLEMFDFGFGDEPYKDRYCNVIWHLRDAILPSTAAGHVWALGMAGRRFATARLRGTPIEGLIKTVRRIRRRPATAVAAD